MTASTFGISPDAGFPNGGSKKALVSFLETIEKEFFESPDTLFQTIIDRAGTA